MRLILGDKAYSTWSLRPWLVLKRCGADFEEVIVPLNRPDTAEGIARHTGSGKVPVLEVEGETIWDSLAISLWAEERYPRVGLWPSDSHARWMARAAVCEMHSAFAALRTEGGMGPDHPMVGDWGAETRPSAAVAADLRRLIDLWSQARARFGASGPHMFGEWSIADAFFTPVAARIRHYGWSLEALGDDGTALAYIETLLSQPDFLEWEAGATS
ncbi:glutathione S-transferase [Brevundimonas lutea]|uniref:glutathione S-transferase n=1 Tax=Brevundimonas lutea TaxID=2293980 RepID=UPI000F012855|nr:glutathione S-transferase [Brevundimonas lutea]